MKTLQMLVSSVSLAFNAQTKNERTVLQIFFFGSATVRKCLGQNSCPAVKSFITV